MIKLFLAIGFLFLLAPASRAATYYISDGGGSVSCGADGTQSTQAYNFSGYTTGDTLKLCGVIAHALTVQADNISILFESNASIQVPSCYSVGGCIELHGHNGGLIDGGTPCGSGTTCASNFGDYGMGPKGTGYIIQTAVGTPPAAITNITCSGGIATVTGPAAFGYTLPHEPPITISGNSVSAYNATVTVLSDNDGAKTFTFAATCGGTGTGGQAGVLCPNGSYCSSQQSINMIDTQNSGGCGWEIRNLLIGPFYLNVSTALNQGGSSDEFESIFMSGCTGTWKVHDLTEANAGNTYVPAGASDSHFQFYNNQLNGMTVGLAVAGSSLNLGGMQVYNNTFQDVGLGDTVGCQNHTSNIHSWAITGGVSTGENIYNNRFTGIDGGCLTGSIFLEGTHQATHIFNNFWNATYTQNNNGVVNINGPGPFLIANNTLVGAQASDTCFNVGSPSGSPAITFENNVASGCNTLLLWQNSPTIIAWDYSDYGCDNKAGAACPGGLTSTSTIICVYSGSCAYYDLAQMQGTLSIDAHSAWNFNAGSTGINTSSGAPSSATPGGVTGTNLTSLGIAALDSDISGNARPASGAWTVGAFQSGGARPMLLRRQPT